MITVNLKSYLERLKAIETLKSGSKRDVPNMDQLAKMVGLHRGTMNRIANNHTSAIRFKLLGSIITALRGLGFNTSVSDILVYDEAVKI